MASLVDPSVGAQVPVKSIISPVVVPVEDRVRALPEVTEFDTKEKAVPETVLEVKVWEPVPEVRANDVDEALFPTVIVSAPVPPVPMLMVSAAVAPVPARLMTWVPAPDPRLISV